MKIGILTHNYPRNLNERKDAGIFLKDFAHELALKNKVYVFAPEFGGKKDTGSKVSVSWFDWGGSNEKLGDWNVLLPKSMWYFIKLLVIGSQKAVEFARENNLDYCLAAWSIPSGVYAYVVNKITKTPYGVWNLGSDINKYVKYPVLGSLIKLSIKNADHVFANSLDLAKKIKLLCGRKVVVLPAVTKFRLSKINAKKNKNKKYKFLFVGRLEKVKGADVLLSAIKILKDQHPDLDFYVNILGGGTMEVDLKKTVDKFEVSENVNFVGWADEKMVSKYMRASDCLVVPSRSESLPLVIIEASKSKLLVIASDVGDCPFLIKKYKIGFTFPVGKESVLSDFMYKIAKTGVTKKPEFESLNKYFSVDKSIEMFEHTLTKSLNIK